MMDTKEQAAAGNALIGWFNSQEIPPSDATAIMSKVLAKLLIATATDRANITSRAALTEAVDRFTFQLVHEINNRSFETRRK